VGRVGSNDHAGGRTWSVSDRDLPFGKLDRRENPIMSRYKGRPRALRTEQEFPHHVNIVVPPGGLGTRLDAMYEFHAQQDIKPQRGHGTHTADGAVIRWCFADAETAAAFSAEFFVR
jgi:hypothetical protein